MDLQIRLIGGYCPVQAEGTIGGEEFYFRARGQRWTMGIGGDPVMEPAWFYEEPYGAEPFAAGWMDIAEARAFIEREAARYLAEIADPNDGQPDEAQEWANYDADC